MSASASESDTSVRRRLPLCLREVGFCVVVIETDALRSSTCASDYDPDLHQGVSYSEAMGRIHAIRGDGTILRDVAVFREAYRLIGLGWIYAPTRWPLFGSLADWTYRAWASRRLQVTGRESLEVLCANRCQPVGADQAG